MRNNEVKATSMPPGGGISNQSFFIVLVLSKVGRDNLHLKFAFQLFRFSTVSIAMHLYTVSEFPKKVTNNPGNQSETTRM